MLRQELIDAEISLNDDIDIISLQNLSYLVSSCTLDNSIIWKRKIIARS